MKTAMFAAVLTVLCQGCNMFDFGFNPPESEDEGFTDLFNGKDLSGWEGATDTYVVEEGGILACNPGAKGSGGNLYTAREYSDFILRFEFRIPTNANNGVGIRFPAGKNAAFEGMEIQIIDDNGPAYAGWLKDWQHHGSIYGVVPSRQDAHDKKHPNGKSHLLPVGMWNFEEIRATGSRITVLLNGEIITDADVSKFKTDGSTIDKKHHPGLHNKKGRIGWLGHGYHVQWRNIRIKEVGPGYREGGCPALNKAPKGFTALFDGKTLAGWKGVTTKEHFDNPLVRQAATPEKRAEMQAAADKQAKEHWHVRDGALYFDGLKGGYSLATAKDYKDFEMFCDWRLLTPRGDSGLYLRGSPQVQIWDAHNMWNIGSGGLYNNKKNPSSALCIADRQIGDWNRFHITMKGEKVTVVLNGKTVVDNVTMENYWDYSRPIFPCEQIELQCHGDPVEFRNIFIREL